VKDLPGWGADIIPLFFGILQKNIRVTIILIEKGKKLLLKNLDARMGSEYLVNLPLHPLTSLLYM
jgi:hypothetical protein